MTTQTILPSDVHGVMLSDPLEIWADIPGYKRLYQVSTLGRVRSLCRKIAGKGRHRKGTVLKVDVSGHGYPRVTFSKNNIQKRFLVSRLVLSAFCGEPLSGMECNHKDGNPRNNNFTNLEWVTKSENNLHAIHVLGRQTMCGELNGHSKLTEDQVREIRWLYKHERGKWTQDSLGEKYGVTRGAIKAIVHNISWRYLL